MDCLDWLDNIKIAPVHIVQLVHIVHFTQDPGCGARDSRRWG